MEGQDGGPPLAQLLIQLTEQFASFRQEQIREREHFAQQLAELRASQAQAQPHAREGGGQPPFDQNNDTPSPTNPPPSGSPSVPENSPAAINTTNDATTRRKPSLPDPPRFTGLRRRFRAWELEMRSKLQVDGPAIGPPFYQFAYIYSRLDETPQALAATFFAQGGSRQAYDPADFLSYLATCYGDPNAEQKALGRLESMTQGEQESLAMFIPKFEKELADSGGAAWSDAVKINHLKRTINDALRTELAGQLNLPRDYSGFVNALQGLDANLEELRHHLRRKKTRAKIQLPLPNRREATPKTQPGTNATMDEMDWEPTRISQAILKANEELKGKRAKWVDQDEIARRKEEGRCLRCGRTGCRVAKCPLLPPRRPRQLETSVKRFKPVTKAEIEEEDEGADQSSSDQSDGELKE